MNHDPNRRERRSLRLPDYDYRRDGFYFVTICIDDREPRLGRIVDGRVEMTEAGRMIEWYWRSLPDRFPNVALDAFVVMPDHVHGIIVIRRGEPCVRPEDGTPTTGGDHEDRPYKSWRNDHDRHPRGTDDGSLGRIIQAFKSLTTNAYIRGVRHRGWPPFDRRLWQRNYYERVIRNEAELHETRDYIRTNPGRAMK